MANINSVITYNANLSPAQAQIKALTGQVGALSAAFNTLDKSALSAQRSLAATFTANVGQIGGFTAQTVKATTAVETFGKQIAANRLTMREYFREAFTGYARQNSMLRQLAAQQVRYEQSVAVPTGPGQAMLMTPQSINAASSAAQLASQRFSIFNQLVNGGATAMLNWGKNTQWAGRQLMVGFTLPLALFAGVMSKQFRELDKELTRFQKVYGSDLGNAVSESTQKMREQVQQLAYDISSAYGIAAKETAALAADIAATGAEGEQLMASVQQTTRLAVLGEVDRQEAMKATLSLQSAFRLNTNELAESINFLNAVENQTSATLEDLSVAIPKVGPVIRSLGGDVKDLATLLVAMREGGIPAAEAANALKSGLASLINPTKQASEVAKQFGVDLVGIVEANRGQLMPTIFAMQDALNGLDSFSRSRIIEQIFGKYQFARISALFDNIGRTGSQTQQVIELATRSSAELAAVANGEIRTLTESTAVKFQRTLEQLKNALMPIGQALTETLIPVFEKVGQGLKAFSTFFTALPDSVQGLAKWAVALTALAGPVIMLVGLFGNLIANGLKFGMMIVRIGARIGGLKTEKFQLLNSDVMAAKLGVDNLTTSFVNQETAMNRLVGVMSAYEASLRKLTISNPALFIPGAVPGPRGVVPIRRQAGSTRPEFVPGSGRGDKIPAMLEPGEFIVNRAATEKYAPVLLEMNRGTLKGFAKGTQSKPVSISGGQSRILAPYTMFAPDPEGSGGFGMSRTFFETSNDFELSLRASVIAAKGVEENLRLVNSTVNSLSVEIAPITQQITEALRITATEMTAAGQDTSHISKIIDQASPRIEAILANVPESTSTAVRKLLSPTMEDIAGGEYYRVPSADIDPDTGKVVRTTIRSDRRGEAGSFFGRVKGVAGKLGLNRVGMVQAHLPEEKYSMPGPVVPMSGKGMALSPELRKSAEDYIERKGQEILEGFEEGIVDATETQSPSKRMDREMVGQGKDFGEGAVKGFVRGYESSSASKPLVAKPVGAGGIESISNAQKIAQADKSILAYKQAQSKFASQRLIAEQQVGNINAEIYKLEEQYKRGQITIVQLHERRTALLQQRKVFEDEIASALQKEKVYQDKINEQKQRIANADTAQARSEEEEAKNAARRATASMVGPGGIYGPGGYNVFGTVGRKDTDPGPIVPVDPTSTGPGRTIKNSQDQAMGTRGGGVMNAAFMASTAMSSVAMLGGASSDAAAKIGLFSTALMTATMLMQSVSAKGMFTNFLGMGSLGKKASVTGRAMNIAAGGASRGGAALMGLGRGLSLLGGPVGIAAGLGITAAITGFMMYRNAAEEARERAIAAFNDPVKSAEYFGETIANVSDIIEKNRLSNISEDLQEVDQALRDAVSQDYAPLIEQIKFLSAGAGAQQLSVAYSNMILSGMSAENAKAAVEAIAAEAGIAGGEAFNEAVAQGFLNELTTSEALQNIIGQFKPSETTYGKTGETLETRLRKDIAQAERDLENARRAADEQAAANARAVGGEPLPDWFPDFMKPSAVNPEVERLTNLVDQLRDRLEDLMSINPELISGVLDSLILAYQQDPTAAINGIKEFADTINSLENEDDRTAALDRVTNYLRDSYGEQWIVVGESIDTANEKLLAAQMLAAGISLDRAVNSAYEFDSALAQSLITAKLLADEAGRAASELQTELTDEIVSDIEDQRRTVETEMQDIENANAKIIRGYNRRKREAQTAFETEQEGRQENIDSMQDEMDQSRRIFDEEMQQLDDKKEAVSKSSEAYIDSLEKTQKAESFYSQQRKTAFGALQKLASGDVFGFLQERQQMSQDAQEFSYDEMISGIEERRDLELDAIDEVREKKQREQDEYEQMMEDRIKAEQDLMDEQQKNHDLQMEHYDKQIKKAEREKDRKIAVKREEIEELNTMQETASRDILEFQRKYAKEYEKYDQYARQLENLKILRVQEIYFRGGINLFGAAARAGIPFNEISDFIEKNAKEFAFVENAGTSFAQSVIPTGATYYKGMTTPLPDTQDLSQTVKDMTVTGDIVVNGDIVGGSGGSGSDPSTWAPGTAGDTREWNGETYTYSPGSGWVPAIATGGYIKNGRVNLQDGGGTVKGPGGPKSDVIPAMLSNGEYVIQASSVNKYGTDLMHSINAGKFATGGYISADRAEYAASQKPKYSGGTPTYSSGYNSANKQASYIPGVTRPKKINSPSLGEEVSSIVGAVRSGLATAFDALATGFIPPWMRTSENTTTGVGRFIGGSQYKNSSATDRAMLAMGLLPVGRGAYSRTSHMTDITGLTSILGQGAKAVGGGVEGRGFYTGKFKNLIDIYQEGAVNTPWRGLGDFVVSGGSKDANIYKMSLEERLALDNGGTKAFDELTDSLKSQGYQAMEIPFRNGSNMVKYIADDVFSPSHIMYQGREGLLRKNVPNLAGANPLEIIKALGIPTSKATSSFQNRFGRNAQLPEWMQILMASNKFADGGLAAPDKGLFGILSKVPGKEKTAAPGTTGMPGTGMPGTGTYGSPTSAPSTTTNFPGAGGPNSWPYSGFPIASGRIPGTSVSIQMNKDVLPLFLAFASDYNKLIRPIQSGITGGYRGVDPKVGNASNHPSGTALDTNWSQEGSHYSIFLGSEEERQANYNWWMGKKSALAPWKSISPVPYKTMNALMSKYKVLQWFGPAKLGGPSWLDWTSSDPMHVQINQDTDPSPQRVSQVIGELGINQDGTFNRPSAYAAGGFISGPGGPRSDIIPAMLSNGEYVVKASSVSKYGKGFMDQINAGQFGMGGLATTVPRMVSPVKYADGGFVGSMSGATPTFGVPQMQSINPSSMNANIANSYGGSNKSSVRNSSKVNIVINGAGGKSTNAIANKVISMINQANGRRNHSRSAG